ncbi:MAG: FIG000875: Thioredoxin domain-containing protein EC-YbbN [uncultured Lysobacter sp.]|uniref:Thioredoxin n=1 Tax=uncultured Lysobacter sp. TaxID=271060 RepID=A0A6J4LDW4_9GAMM|nr:MAG: FIG000875: Thioredoxin domain-containing protein EC-YbbN [uncultured Lysobacter sp.]
MTDSALPHASAHVFDVTTADFETSVIRRSLETPVLVDFWAEWCGPCKQFGPVLEKLAAEYNGAFVLAKVDVDKEPQIGAAFQVRSIPTVFLVKDGQLADGFPGVLPEGQVREFLRHHGIEPAAAVEVVPEATPALDPQAEVERLRAEVAATPDKAELRLDLALALAGAGEPGEAERLLDGLPANLATDERAIRTRARLAFLGAVETAPPQETLEAAVAANPADLRARHLLGARHLLAGQAELALEQFLEMLRLDRGFDDGLPKKALIDAFRVIEDAELVGRYRRRMASLLF